MAKRKKSHSTSAHSQRASHYSTRSLTPRVVGNLSPPRFSTVLLHQIEDRRNFNPDGDFRPVRTISGSPAKTPRLQPNVNVRPHKVPSHLVAKLYGALYEAASKPQRRVYSDLKQTKARLEHVAPRSTIVCLKRKIRTEVLHATRKAGKGHRAPRRNPTSDIHCG